MTGYVQVYTGDGKGKTTAALGLALRALGAGLRVGLVQFVKGRPTSELQALERFGDRVRVQRFGRATFIGREPAPEDVAAGRAGLAAARDCVLGGEFDLVILDEANLAVHFRLFGVDELLDLLEHRPGHVEVVVTGRGAHPELLARADLVTEMREVKHYFAQGVPARRGIEE